MKHYSMDLNIQSDGVIIARITVTDKTYDTLRELINIAIADLDRPKVPPLKKKPAHKSIEIKPPIEVIGGPSQKDIEDI